jgi:hypothetical protein
MARDRVKGLEKGWVMAKDWGTGTEREREKGWVTGSAWGSA